VSSGTLKLAQPINQLLELCCISVLSLLHAVAVLVAYDADDCKLFTLFVIQSESHAHESERTVLKLQAEVDRLQGSCITLFFQHCILTGDAFIYLLSTQLWHHSSLRMELMKSQLSSFDTCWPMAIER